MPIALARQHRPRHPRHLVGQRHDDHVAVRSGQKRLEPAPPGIAAPRQMRQRRPGAVDQQGAQMLVAAIGDAEQALLAAGRMLARRQAQPGRQVPASGERRCSSHRRHQGRRIERPDAGALNATAAGTIMLGDCHIASPELQLAMALAMYTGQRQGDLLCLSWSNYDGQFIRLRQSKTKKRVTIKCGPVLNKILGAIKRRDATTILTSPSGRAWKADHFRHEWAEACKRAGITDLHFHDLRGTAVTLLSESGATPQEIASMTGWAYQSVETILERYSARTAALSAVAARRLEQALERTYGEQMLQTELQTKPLTKAGNGSK
jgi:integrase